MIARVFPRRTTSSPSDEHCYFDIPPRIGLPKYDEVHVSCVFTWDMRRAEFLVKQWQLVCDNVQIGGPCYNSTVGAFKAGMYIKKGHTITSRGCPNKCPWCFVPEREGKLVELAEIEAGNIIQDNNFMACSKTHRDKVYQMLRAQSGGIVFYGGLESRRITPWDADQMLCFSRKPVLFFACDTSAALRPLRQACNLVGLPRRYKRCYVMIGNHNKETVEEAEQRIIDVWRAGAWPNALLYQPKTGTRVVYNREWWALKERWCPSHIVQKNGALVDAGRTDEIYRGGKWRREKTNASQLFLS